LSSGTGSHSFPNRALQNNAEVVAGEGGEGCGDDEQWLDRRSGASDRQVAYGAFSAPHSASHARLAPDEEFIPYLLHVIGRRAWPEAHFHIMAELQASEPKCRQCEYRAGHGKLLTATEEKRLKKGSACL
jgi:hypothetical protein